MGDDRDVAEAVVERHLVRRVKALQLSYPYTRTIIKKVGGSGWRGWPDRMVLYSTDGGPGCAHWIELKRPKGGKFEPLQRRCHEKLRGMGFVVRVLNTKAQVGIYIDEVVKYGPHNVARG